MNFETQKHTQMDRNPPITNHYDHFCFLGGLLRCEGKKAPIFQILIDISEKPKIQRCFSHRRSGVTQHCCKRENGSRELTQFEVGCCEN